MKKRIIGGILALCLVVGGVVLFFSNQETPSPTTDAGTNLTVVNGVIGSEKKPFFEDKRVKQILADNGLQVDVETAGSRQIATDVDLTKYDFAFPSSAPAAQKIEEKTKVSKTYSPFSSPMVIASYEPILELLAKNGVASKDGEGVWHFDMAAYLALTEQDVRWTTLTTPDPNYKSNRSILITSTDIRKSNSAAMYLAIASYVLNGNNVVSSQEQQDAIIDGTSKLFLNQGYSGSSSDEPFQDYLTQGSGAVPLVMVYEAQFVGESLKDNSRLTKDMVMAYSDPTVFSKHTLIPFNKNADKLGELLSSDPELIKLEASFGFRTSDMQAFTEVTEAKGIAVEQNLVNIADTPSYDVLEKMITAISERY